MKVHGLCFVLTVLGLGVAGGCSSPAGDSSSSSHWIACDAAEDCGAGNTCEGGYCVGPDGSRLTDTTPIADERAACDPYAAPEISLQLEEVLGAGQDPSSGARYVLDRAASGERLFLSEGDMLRRRAVLGTGEGGEGGITWLIATFDAGSGAQTFYVETNHLVASVEPFVRTFLIPGQWRPAPGEGLPSEAIALDSLDEATVLAMPVAGWVNWQKDEYHVEVEGGGRLIVLRPNQDWTYDDFRVFYGVMPTVTEYRVTRVTRARDGGSTHVEFDLDGVAADAFFPSFFPFQGDGTLTVGGEVLELIELPWVNAIVTYPSEYLCLLR